MRLEQERMLLEDTPALD